MVSWRGGAAGAAGAGAATLGAAPAACAAVAGFDGAGATGWQPRVHVRIIASAAIMAAWPAGSLGTAWELPACGSSHIAGSFLWSGRTRDRCPLRRAAQRANWPGARARGVLGIAPGWRAVNGAPGLTGPM